MVFRKEFLDLNVWLQKETSSLALAGTAWYHLSVNADDLRSLRRRYPAGRWIRVHGRGLARVTIALVAVAAVVAATGALRSPAIGKAFRKCTLTTTKVSHLGEMTVCVSYR